MNSDEVVNLCDIPQVGMLNIQIMVQVAFGEFCVLLALHFKNIYAGRLQGKLMFISATRRLWKSLG